MPNSKTHDYFAGYWRSETIKQRIIDREAQWRREGFSMTKTEAERLTELAETQHGVYGQLPPPQTTVDSVSRYMDVLRRVPNAVLFRGEPSEFAERVCAMLRGRVYQGIQYPIANANALCEEFYRRVFSRLTDNERENFYAFCQHYGLPTNLIDVSESPLVALYFACADDNGRNGHVHMFERGSVDLTDILCGDTARDFTELFAVLLGEKRGQFLDKMRKHRTQYNDAYCELCARVLIFLCGVMDDNKRYKLLDGYNAEYAKFICERDGKKSASALCGDFEAAYVHWDGSEFQRLCVAGKWKQSVQNIPFLYNEPKYYLHLLDETFKMLRLNTYAQVVYWLDFLPNFVYKPLMSFDRAVRQGGEFLVQGYIHTANGALGFQQPAVSLTVRVPPEAKRGIISELDRLGVNEASIFGDIENTARYVLRTFEQASIVESSGELNKFDNTVVSGADVRSAAETSGLPVFIKDGSELVRVAPQA